MPAPYIVASYTTNYSTTGTTKNVSVSCQKDDSLIILASGGLNTDLSTPTASGLSFASSGGSIGDGSSPANISWTAARIDSQTNTVITVGESTGLVPWGFTCLVIRNVRSPIQFSTAVGTAATAQNSSSVTSSRPMILENVVDGNARDGSTRSWITVDGQSPSAGNGRELTYQYIPGAFTAMSAYYLPSSGGSKAFGVTSGGGTMQYKTVYVFIYGDDAPLNISAQLPIFTTGTTRSNNHTIPTTVTYLLAAVFIGVRPANGNDSAVTVTMTCGSRSFSSLGKVHANSGNQGFVELFHLTSPPNSLQTFTATASTSVDITYSYCAFNSVDLANPISSLQTAAGNSSSASVSFSSLTNRETIYSVVVSGNTITSVPTVLGSGRVNSNNSTLYNTLSDGGSAAHSVVGMPGTSQTISYTVANAPWAMMSVAINPGSYFPPQAISGFVA